MLTLLLLTTYLVAAPAPGTVDERRIALGYNAPP
jgi:hypothetical protein